MTWSSLVPHINNCLKLTHRPRRHLGSFSLCRTWTHAGDLDKDHSQWGSDVKIQWFLLRNSKVSLSLFFFGIVSLILISASLLMFSLSSLSQKVITSVRGFYMLIKKKFSVSLSLSFNSLQIPNIWKILKLPPSLASKEHLASLNTTWISLLFKNYRSMINSESSHQLFPWPAALWGFCRFTELILRETCSVSQSLKFWVQMRQLGGMSFYSWGKKSTHHWRWLV